MTSSSSRARRRRRGTLLLLALGSAAAVSESALASHPHSGWHQLHISTMHENGPGTTGPGPQDEEYCTQSYTADVSSSALAGYIENVLVKMPGKQWDGAADYRVDLWRTPKFCDQYTPAERALIEIEYQVASAWPNVPLCGNTQFSCTVLSKPTVDPSGQHQHYDWAVIHFQSRHVRGLDSRARNFINHETGHVFGLADPRFRGDCEESVMHNALYGCTQFDYVVYPTARDLASVTRIAKRQN